MSGQNGKRILVVDDDVNIRSSLQLLLKKAGYNVVSARDGEEAIRMWRTQPADLVITDLYMPEMNGLEIIMELRAHSPGTPIIAISGGGSMKHFESLDDAKLLGAVHTIKKPFTMAEMKTLVERLLKPAVER